MSNYYGEELRYHFGRMDLTDAVAVLEHDYTEQGGPSSYDDAVDMYGTALEFVGDISANFIAPRAAGVDTHGAQFESGDVTYAPGSEQSYRRLADAGFAGVIIPRRFGGLNFPASVYVMMIEMVSRADASLMTMFGYQDIGEAIANLGPEAVAAEYLPRYAAGDHIAAMVMTEPGAGSDLASIRLRAYEDDTGQWRLRGVKHFISNGNGQLLFVLARSEGDVDGMLGLSLFACHGGDRVHVNRLEEKMGLHGSPTCELYFDDAPAHLVGKRRQGLIHVLSILNHARFSVAAQGLGIADAAYRAALAWAQEREQFGKKIIDMAPVANLLLDMSATLQSCRSMLYAGTQWLDLRNKLEEKIAHMRSAGHKPSSELRARFRYAASVVDLLSPAVKYHVTEAANRICYDAQQIHGGMGYMREMPVERYVRDVRITTIYEGTSQIQIGASLDLVLNDTLAEEFTRLADIEVPEALADLEKDIKRIRGNFDAAVAEIRSRDDVWYRDAAGKDLVDMYLAIYRAHLLLTEAVESRSKEPVARRDITQSLAASAAQLGRIEAGVYDDVSAVRDLLT
ncbi:MAG: acyl-CoA dehydrogenase family protein [Acidimicrobiia bacterium]|nr:acyl-CoA dehydrogenase family protein [Acidimicrobiia bacterium]